MLRHILWDEELEIFIPNPANHFSFMFKSFQIAKDSARLTHSNALGYNGAILQTCAVHLALHADPKTFNNCVFVDKLLGIMASQEKTDSEDSPPEKRTR